MYRTLQCAHCITFKYEATNTSQDSIRWNIRAPGPTGLKFSRSLMDSDVTVRIPIKILPKVCYRFLEYPAGNVAINDGLDVGAVQAAPNVMTDAELILKQLAHSPGVDRNLGTCERMSAIWKAVASVVVQGKSCRSQWNQYLVYTR